MGWRWGLQHINFGIDTKSVQGCHSCSLLFMLNVYISADRNINLLLLIITKKSKSCKCSQPGDCLNKSMSSVCSSVNRSRQAGARLYVTHWLKPIQDHAGLQSKTLDHQNKKYGPLAECLHSICGVLASTPALGEERKRLVVGEQAAAQQGVSLWGDEHSEVIGAWFCKYTKTSVLHTWCVGP